MNQFCYVNKICIILGAFTFCYITFNTLKKKKGKQVPDIKWVINYK